MNRLLVQREAEIVAVLVLDSHVQESEKSAEG